MRKKECTWLTMVEQGLFELCKWVALCCFGNCCSDYIWLICTGLVSCMNALFGGTGHKRLEKLNSLKTDIALSGDGALFLWIGALGMLALPFPPCESPYRTSSKHLTIVVCGLKDQYVWSTLNKFASYQNRITIQDIPKRRLHRMAIEMHWLFPHDH